MMSINAAVGRLRIAAGHVPGVRLVDVTFRNPDIGTGTVPETVSPVGGLIADI